VVFRNPGVFDPDYVPETLLYRNPELREISSCLEPALRGRRASNARVYGRPATGKTTAVRLLLGQLREQPKAAPAYVNCKFQSDRHSILCQVHKEVRGHAPGQATSFSRVCEAVFQKTAKEGRFLVVVLDDINYVKGASDVLYTLLRAHETYPGVRASVIAIASSPRFRVPLEDRVASSFVAREVYFRPYTREEVLGILKNRAQLGFAPGVLSRVALEEIAGLAHERDLRFGIELLKESGEAAEEEGSREIRQGHVDKALERLQAGGRGDILPRGGDAILKALNAEGPMISGELYGLVREEVGSYSTFSRRIAEMERLRILRSEETNKRGRTRMLYPLVEG
jgi:cell division control protein 6